MFNVDLGSLESELTEMALAGEEFPAILDAIARKTSFSPEFIGVHGENLRESEPSPPRISPHKIASAFHSPDPIKRFVFDDNSQFHGITITGGNRRFGILILPGNVSAQSAGVLESARVAVAIDGVRKDTVRQARAENARQIVDDLRFGSVNEPDRVLRAAQQFGLELDEAHCGVVFHYDGPQRQAWATALSWLPMPVHHSGPVAWAVMGGDARRELPPIRTRMQGIVGEYPVLVATGRTVSDVNSTALSFQTAESALNLLKFRGGRVQLFGDLGVEQLLLELPVRRLRDFFEQKLGPIANREDLIATLQSWFDEDGSRNAVADRLFVHRNTVGYRLSLIKQLLGEDCLEPKQSPQLYAAMQARQIVLSSALLIQRNTP